MLQAFLSSIQSILSRLSGKQNPISRMNLLQQLIIVYSFIPFQIIRDIYDTKGVRGFYAGSLPNMTRVLVRNSYRYPLMVALPKFYQNNLPASVSSNKSFQKILTGSSIAFIEACLTCPIERTKVYFMTNSQKGLSYYQFFSSIKGQAFNQLFRGFTPLFMRQFISWGVFLQADLFAKTKIRSHLNLREDQSIPIRYLMCASVFVAAVNTCLVIPFDCVKTHMEKVDPTSTYLKTFRNIYSQAGILGFFTGVRLRFLLYLTNAIFIVNILEKLDNISQKLTHSK